MPKAIVEDVSKRCRSGDLKTWEKKIKDERNLSCDALGEAVASIIENARKKVAQFTKISFRIISVEDPDGGDFIHVRVMEPGDFKEGSIRTIDIDESRGIKARVGRPQGKEMTEVQVWLFDKEKGWSKDEARKWVKDHESKAKQSFPTSGQPVIAGDILAKLKAQVSGYDEQFLFVQYRNQLDFAPATLEWKEIDGGIRGLFGRLVPSSAPRDYDGTPYLMAAEFPKDKWNEPQAMEYLKKKFALADTVDVVDVNHHEVFRVGKWNGDPYTIKDLEEAVRAYEAGVLVPYLKLGHNESQKAVALFLDGMPMFGKAKRVYIEGDRLYVDWVGVPRRIAKIIEAAYPKKSCEFYIEYQKDGNSPVYPIVLSAVALLGDNLPAVSDLKDVVELFEPQPAAHFKRARAYTEDQYKEGTMKIVSEPDGLVEAIGKLKPSPLPLAEKLRALYSMKGQMWHQCVSELAARGDVKSPENVCTLVMGRKNEYTKADGTLVKLAASEVLISRSEMCMLDPEYEMNWPEGQIGMIVNTTTWEIKPVMEDGAGGGKKMSDQKVVPVATQEDVKKLTDQNAELTKKLAEQEKVNKMLLAERERGINQEIAREAKELVSAGKLAPAGQAAYVTLKKVLSGMDNTVKKFSMAESGALEEETLEVFLTEMLDELVENIPVKGAPQKGEKMSQDGADKDGEELDPETPEGRDALNARVDKFIQEKNWKDTHTNRRMALQQILLADRAAARTKGQ